MSDSGVRLHNGVRGASSGVVEYGLLAALLVALAVSQHLLSGLARAVADLHPYRIDAQVFGTAVYAVVGGTVAGIGYLAYRESREEPRLDSDERIRVALACGLLFVVGVYTALGAADASAVAPGRYLLGPLLVSVAGMGLPAVAYLRVWGDRLRFEPPDRSTLPTVAGAVLIPLLLAVALWAVARFAPGFPSSWLLGPEYAGSAPGWAVVSRAAVGSAFGAFGTAVTFHGAVQETLRDHAGPTAAVAGVTVLVAVYRVAFARLPRVEGVAALGGVVVAGALVAAVAALAVGVWRALGERIVNGGLTAAAGFGIVAVVLLLGGAGLALESPGGAFVGYALGHAVTVGVAAVAYERTRSVWVPVAALASFSAAFEVAASL
ncbi:hypothetical protein NGM10_00625 [Halorussus salilacus]|uniref:hypothetical protein n=1 Tax=Halorussus salilacus TaxID=2953750 RepID=UPI00209FF9F0|nr:hypothetical protein [Halorussus salilacus]USZ68261.1 hypothetical protein NGM10_00625 [Halorussus salilacus]